MQVINLVKPKLKKTTMKCDECIDEKMCKYPAVECAFAQCNFTMILAKMGAGKTSSLISFLRKGGPLYHCYDNCYVIIPEISLHSIDEADNIFVNNLKPESIFHEYNPEVLEEIYTNLLSNAKKDQFSILVIDDMGALFKKDKYSATILNKIITKMRHLKVTVILLCQNVYQVPKGWREIATNLITFNLGKSQMSKIFKEFYDFNEEQYLQIMKLYKDPHDWLLLNLKHNRLFYKFDKEITFEKDEDKEDEQEDKREDNHK